jgi:hypothetical protein
MKLLSEFGRLGAYEKESDVAIVERASRPNELLFASSPLASHM